jgi:hypothetical protein
VEENSPNLSNFPICWSSSFDSTMSCIISHIYCRYSKRPIDGRGQKSPAKKTPPPPPNVRDHCWLARASSTVLLFWIWSGTCATTAGAKSAIDCPYIHLSNQNTMVFPLPTCDSVAMLKRAAEMGWIEITAMGDLNRLFGSKAIWFVVPSSRFRIPSLPNSRGRYIFAQATKQELPLVFSLPFHTKLDKARCNLLMALMNHLGTFIVINI